MDLATTFRVALRALARNKMRTVLTMLGIIGVGAVGVIVGVFGSSLVSNMLHSLTSIPPEAILLVVAFSAGVGIFFGYYPARKASSLDPIEALRYE